MYENIRSMAQIRGTAGALALGLEHRARVEGTRAWGVSEGVRVRVGKTPQGMRTVIWTCASILSEGEDPEGF